MRTHDVVTSLRRRGVTLLATTDGKLRIEGVELLTETEKAALKAHKRALLQTLCQSMEAVNDGPTATRPQAPSVGEVPLVMTAGGKTGGYAPNCNRCQHYRWRAETCQRQGRVAIANTPPCGGTRYQPFAPTLVERDAAANAPHEESP